ncbi:hypothetical protein [Glycomyces algeriensis]|uniref:Uncharacterized protein n=1 Tax=Glycomyces algeriensis TaxID=256037 RepID=A0A9W6GCR6_9ACTN|nr:hypothetical protein [Glycomyces algeriensis]MDA1368347.1 hypothetical protein [Glycomyces algeriensis]MDR7351789.1 hypothetical protein [Glycomyces algeriensis]GLI44516.1 hypothetical protein GALLR39Z86_43660 [Glycomyces algeriensis]
MNDEPASADIKARIRELVLRNASPGRPQARGASCNERRDAFRGDAKRPRRYFGGSPPGGVSTQIWVTKPILRTRGWTETAIRDFLPGPERYKSNPHHMGARRPMPLWSAETVGRVEASAAWQAWLGRSLQRRRTSLEALRRSRDQGFLRRTAAVNAAVTAFQRADARRRG